MLRRFGRRLPRLAVVWADSAYRAKALVAWVEAHCRWVVEAVGRRPGQRSFEVRPWRWIAERTFGWFGRYRRLSKDDEAIREENQGKKAEDRSRIEDFRSLIARIEIELRHFARNSW